MYQTRAKLKAQYKGSVNVIKIIRGYHPEIDRQMKEKEYLPGKRTKYTAGNEIPFPNVNAARYIDGLGQEAMFIFKSGRCTVYNVFHKHVTQNSISC